jgi:hypothetical protein
LLLHELPAQQAFSTMSQPENATPSDTTFPPAFEQHVDTTQQPDTSRPTNLPTSWDHITLPCTPELPNSLDRFPRGLVYSIVG